MPSEAVRDTAPLLLIPVAGKGALGRWRALNRIHRPDVAPGCGDNLTGCRA